MCSVIKAVSGLTQEQIQNIRQGLGKYATHRRFVARKGKEPVDPITGYGAKANDPTTWGTLDQALHAMSAYDCDGIGIELGNGLCGIDIDHCITEHGQISEQAQDIISLMQSYTEISPSGNGIHILFSGIIPEGNRRKDGLEMYSEGRYFTVTGNLYEP
jgi:putative DNA primase/helicase